jgi:hypothetical protein
MSRMTNVLAFRSKPQLDRDQLIRNAREIYQSIFPDALVPDVTVLEGKNRVEAVKEG